MNVGGPDEKKAETCRCPFCDMEVELQEESVLCVACKTVIVECVNCGAPVREDAESCPNCGKPPR
jgi:Double zinc ribbon